ncbi:GGDEF domain-containing protein [Sphingomonas immobilis]|uniref:diguanylate cyclase n=1 Tax=Sphingomonas immobilis TaxID=3063997 RepID=A0ABT9A3A2_9SPHN|nr:GGDEF domain-containing protein [Sphingomonas sp. CA1-15]MDO7844318.1 GGDEF domain-containing protein [Sphingomonas sp. CA1-15]
MIHLTSDAAIMFGLALVSAMLSCGLLLSWKVLGGVRHALIWAIAYGIGAVQWFVIGAYNSFWPFTSAAFIGATWAGGIVAILLCVGFRERVGMPRRPRLMIAAAAISGLLIAVPYLINGAAFTLAIPQFMRVIFLPVAALTLVGFGRRATMVEIVTAAILLAFAGFSGFVGWMRLIDCGCETNSGRAVLLIGLPVLFTGAGLTNILLLASDLAQQLRRTARVDPLTEALNRRGFDETAERALAQARRRERPMSVLLFDLDHFKAINDAFSHADGDRVLHAVAQCVRRESRAEDAFGRLGGEEFALLLDNMAPLAAVAMAERIRAAIGMLSVLPDGCRVTASFGVAPVFSNQTLADSLRHADLALYRAKEAGRDRTILYAEPDVARPGEGAVSRTNRRQGVAADA